MTKHSFIISASTLEALVETTEQKIRAAFMGWPVGRAIAMAEGAYNACLQRPYQDWTDMQEIQPIFETGEEEYLFLLKREDLIVIGHHGWAEDDGTTVYMYGDGIVIHPREVSHWMPLPGKPKEKP